MTPEEISVDMFYSLAQKGDAKAQYRLGVVYEKQGNLKEANYWYTKAADQGLPLALEKLGRQPRNLPDHRAIGSANRWPYNSQSLPKRIIIENPGPNADTGIPVEEGRARIDAIVEQQRQDMYEN
jgi:TPR repeat protein